jgi:hypothetical protein
MALSLACHSPCRRGRRRARRRRARERQGPPWLENEVSTTRHSCHSRWPAIRRADEDVGAPGVGAPGGSGGIWHDRESCSCNRTARCDGGCGGACQPPARSAIRNFLRCCNRVRPMSCLVAAGCDHPTREMREKSKIFFSVPLHLSHPRCWNVDVMSTFTCLAPAPIRRSSAGKIPTI